ncbi:MAG: glutathione S-transferase family protein [Silicimonas sp.]|nr:glutathione S-transferase family protein [Silicimonas sp.]
MKLYTNPASPFCRKVEVVLHEAGLTDQITMESVGGHPTNPGTIPVDSNPIGKIPVFEAEGRALFDSRVITRYLDDAHGLGLYPAASLYDVLTLEALADGIGDAAVLMVYESRARAEDKYDPAYVEGQWAKITRALDQLETGWMESLTGALTMGQIATACALNYLDFRHGDRDWRATRPALAAWYESFSTRPAMQATAPKG